MPTEENPEKRKIDYVAAKQKAVDSFLKGFGAIALMEGIDNGTINVGDAKKGLEALLGGDVVLGPSTPRIQEPAQSEALSPGEDLHSGKEESSHHTKHKRHYTKRTIKENTPELDPRADIKKQAAKLLQREVEGKEYLHLTGFAMARYGIAKTELKGLAKYALTQASGDENLSKHLAATRNGTILFSASPYGRRTANLIIKQYAQTQGIELTQQTKKEDRKEKIEGDDEGSKQALEIKALSYVINTILAVKAQNRAPEVRSYLLGIADGELKGAVVKTTRGGYGVPTGKEIDVRGAIIKYAKEHSILLQRKYDKGSSNPQPTSILPLSNPASGGESKRDPAWGLTRAEIEREGISFNDVRTNLEIVGSEQHGGVTYYSRSGLDALKKFLESKG